MRKARSFAYSSARPPYSRSCSKVYCDASGADASSGNAPAPDWKPNTVIVTKIAGPMILNESLQRQHFTKEPQDRNKWTTVRSVLIGVAGLVCFVWTLWLVLLAVYPDATINYIMGTKEYDNGSFWLIGDPGLALTIVGGGGFAAIAVGYLRNLVHLVQSRQRPPDPNTTVQSSTRSSDRVSSLQAMQMKAKVAQTALENSIALAAHDQHRRRATQSVARLLANVFLRQDSSERQITVRVGFVRCCQRCHSALWWLTSRLSTEFASEAGRRRLPNRTAHAAHGKGTLREAHLDSHSADLAQLCGVRLGGLDLTRSILRVPRDDGRRLVRQRVHSEASMASSDMTGARTRCLSRVLDHSFDVLTSVAFPMLVVSWSLAAFTFDHRAFAINLKVFPDGRLERQARLSADPTQVELIDQSLRSLRILSATDFFIRVGSNAILCFRLRRIIAMHRHHVDGQRVPALYPPRRLTVLLFAAIPAVLTAYVFASVSTSAAACVSHPECAIRALRWTSVRDGDPTQCPCISLLDRALAPKTFAEWTTTKNVTGKVVQLASAGDLRSIQLVNRQLQDIPEALLKCKNLKHMYVLQNAVAWSHESHYSLLLVTTATARSTTRTRLRFHRGSSSSRTSSTCTWCPYSL